LATSRPIKKPPKQAISQTLKYTREVVSVIEKRTLAPMLNTATSIGAISRSNGSRRPKWPPEWTPDVRNPL